MKVCVFTGITISNDYHHCYFYNIFIIIWVVMTVFVVLFLYLRCSYIRYILDTLIVTFVILYHLCNHQRCNSNISVVMVSCKKTTDGDASNCDVTKTIVI